MPQLTTTAGWAVPHDSHGNNTAVQCPACGFPVLITRGPVATRGISADNAAECRTCLAKWWIEVRNGDTWLLHRAYSRVREIRLLCAAQ